MRYDSASRCSFLLTFKTVAIRCSFSGVGFLLQNHYPRSTGAPYCRFRTLTYALLRWIRGKPPATGESKSLAWGPLPESIVLDSAGDDAQGVPVRHTTRFIDSSESPMPMACARVDWFAELT